METKKKDEGILLVVSGPSGAGKGTICSAIRKLYPDLNYSVSMTTREPRVGEVEGESYYLLNRNIEDYASGYAGNDCSAFVAQALWGYTIYKGEPAKTGTLYYDDRLRAYDDPAELRCGDILVRHSSHVVMFLYWVDEAHTQAVFIQQGGSEPAINTISAYIQDVSYYTDDFYRLRRLAYFD